MKSSNLYARIGGGHCCLIGETLIKHHDDPNASSPGVVVVWQSGEMVSYPYSQWGQFSQVPDYTGGDEEIEALIRRCNPDSDFKMEDVWASWHESESAINSEVIELAVCATVAAVVFNDTNAVTFTVGRDSNLKVVRADITMKPIHLQYILTNYTIDREPVPDGYKITLRAKDA